MKRELASTFFLPELQQERKDLEEKHKPLPETKELNSAPRIELKSTKRSNFGDLGRVPTSLSVWELYKTGFCVENTES